MVLVDAGDCIKETIVPLHAVYFHTPQNPRTLMARQEIVFGFCFCAPRHRGLVMLYRFA